MIYFYMFLLFYKFCNFVKADPFTGMGDYDVKVSIFEINPVSSFLGCEENYFINIRSDTEKMCFMFEDLDDWMQAFELLKLMLDAYESYELYKEGNLDDSNAIFNRIVQNDLVKDDFKDMTEMNDANFYIIIQTLRDKIAALATKIISEIKMK